MSTPEAADPKVPNDPSTAVIRAWVAVYTRGLPAAEAADRRDVIEADLWDEATAAEWMGRPSSLARQRMSRWARGVPADLSWRFEQRRRITMATRRTKMRIPKGQLVSIRAATVWYVFMLVGLLLSPGFRAWDGVGVAIAGLGLSIAGLVLAISRPQAGFIIGMIGAGVALLAMPWLFPFYAPLPIVLGYRLLRDPATARPPAPGA